MSNPPVYNLATDGRDEAGLIETKGAEYVREDQRNSRPRDLVWVFFGTQLCFGIIVLGLLPIAFGLDWWGAVTSTLVGLLAGSIIFGRFAIIGTSTGTNSPLSSGAHFGILGRGVGTGIGIFTALGFFSLTVWTGGQAFAAGLRSLFGTPESTTILVIGYALIAAGSVALAVYGHANVVFVYRFVVPAMSTLLVIGYFVLSSDFGFSPAAGDYLLDGFWRTWFLSAAAGALLPISYAPYACDYTRYISEERWSRRTVGLFATAGMFAGCSFALVFGIYVATTFDIAKTDWVSGLVAQSPSWYGLMIVFVAIVGGFAQGALCVYGTGLDVSSLLPRLGRVGATIFIGSLVTVFVFLGSLAWSLLDVVTAFVLLLIVVVSPWVVVNILGDIACKGVYFVYDLQVLTMHPRVYGGAYWYRAGWNWAAVIAWAIGTSVGLLSVNTTLYVGPLANMAGGVDVSFVLSAVLAGLLFEGLRRVIPGSQPGSESPFVEAGVSVGPDTVEESGAQSDATSAPSA